MPRRDRKGESRSWSAGISGNERWNARLVSKDRQELVRVVEDVLRMDLGRSVFRPMKVFRRKDLFYLDISDEGTFHGSPCDHRVKLSGGKIAMELWRFSDDGILRSVLNKSGLVTLSEKGATAPMSAKDIYYLDTSSVGLCQKSEKEGK